VNKIILSKDQLKKKIQYLKSKKKRIVLVHGVFDLLHVGHIDYFNEAKSYGDILIVSVTSDEFVLKGPNKPTFDLYNRQKLLSNLTAVNYVVASNHETAEEIINAVKPSIYFKGPDYKNHKQDISMNIKKEILAVKKNKGIIKYGTSKTYSSSKFLNTDVFNSNQIKIIKYLKKKYTHDYIVNLFKNLKNKKALIIGETILDEYYLVDAIGKSGKESVLNFKLYKKKLFPGGVIAIGRNLSNFLKKTKIITYIGENNSYLNFIKKSLNKKIIFEYFKKSNSNTIIKTKIIDKNNYNKYLGLYNFNENKLSDSEIKIFQKKIIKELNRYNIIIVSDYGHNLINEKLSKLLSKNKKIIVNTQLNAANIGYHTIGKYYKTKCAIINEVELRHEMRNKYEKLEILIKKLSFKLQIQNLIVTCGQEGSYAYNLKKKELVHCPAFAKKIIDKLGSGDSFMATFSMFYSLGIKDNKLLLFLSSMGAVEVIKGLGNSNVINYKSLLKSIIYTLK
tara:strand:- start:2283 stop:3800 length:1518 start_codon:yes stop_codon:yes gene_type:complete